MRVRRDIWSRRFSLNAYQTPRNSAAATSEAGFFLILFCEFITAVTFPLSWHFPGNANSYINTMQENENIISSRFIWNFENTFFQIKLSEVIRCVEKAKINYTFIVIKWWSYKVLPSSALYKIWFVCLRVSDCSESLDSVPLRCVNSWARFYLMKLRTPAVQH